MKDETVQNFWLDIRERIQSKWGKCSYSEIDSVRGDLGKLAGIVQKAYGYPRGYAERECHDFQISLRTLLQRK